MNGGGLMGSWDASFARVAAKQPASFQNFIPNGEELLAVCAGLSQCLLLFSDDLNTADDPINGNFLGFAKA